MAEFFLFSGLMYVTTVVFAIMTLFYTYVERNDWGAVQEETEQKFGKDNFGMEFEDKENKFPSNAPSLYEETAKEQEYNDINDDAHSDNEQNDYIDIRL